MKYFDWDSDKNTLLLQERGISFEEVVFHLESGDLLDVIQHPNQLRYGNQRVYVICIETYCWLVPFVEDDEKVFLKTAIPSRRATKLYLGGADNE